jgi:hypothetical protein
MKKYICISVTAAIGRPFYATRVETEFQECELVPTVTAVEGGWCKLLPGLQRDRKSTGSSDGRRSLTPQRVFHYRSNSPSS